MDRDKLAQLRQKKAENKAKLHKELLDSNASIKDAVTALHEVINAKEPVNLDGLAEQIKELRESQTYGEDIKRLEAALRESSDKEKLDEVITAVGNISNKDVVMAVNGLIEKLEARVVDQSPEAYQPVRRVRKIGQRLVFDDDPLQVNVASSGGGGGIASFKDASGRVTQVVLTTTGKVPVELSDGIEVTAASPSGTVDTGNSTNTPLGINATFTGVWVDTLAYSEVIVSVSPHGSPSVTDGLQIQWSYDGINIADADVFTISDESSKTFTFHCHAKYVRIVYTNDGVAQTTFSLQTLLKVYASKGSSHRLKDNLVEEDDAVVTTSLISGYSEATGGVIRKIKVTPSGALVIPDGASTEAKQDDIITAITAPISGTVAVSNFPATQPVSLASVPSHAVTNTGTFAVQSTNQANSGVDIGDVTVNNAAGASAVNIQDGGNSITVDGMVAVSALPTGTNNIGDVDVATLPVDTYSAVAIDATTMGDNTIVAITNAPRLYYICLSANGANSADVTAIVKIGTSEKFKVSLKAGAMFARNIGAGRRYLTGSAGNDIIVNLSAAQTVHVSAEYEDA